MVRDLLPATSQTARGSDAAEMHTHTTIILIHTDDPIIAALLGALLESDGVVHFPESRESLAAAVARVHPHVLITELRHSAQIASSDLNLLIVGSAEECRQMRAAGAHGYALPEDASAIQDRVRAIADPR